MKLIDLFEDQTLQQLHQNIQRGFPNTKRRQHVTHQVNVNNVHFKIDVGSNTMVVTGNTTTTDTGKNHVPVVALKGVNFQSDYSGQNVPVVGEDGQKHTITPVKLSVNTAAVTCDCEDYYHRFSYYNIQNGCHLGNAPEPYQRKTDDWPEVNPLHVPGMCKHILKIVEVLKRKRILA